jgi:pyocin large subunit-like protein
VSVRIRAAHAKRLHMNPKTLRVIAGIVLALIAVFVLPKIGGSGSPDSVSQPATSASAPNSAQSTTRAPQSDAKSSTSTTPSNPKPAPKSAQSKIGFTTSQHWQEHFEKHGAEFGDVTKDEYLALAQALRDAPVGGSILEAVRDDGSVSRFDKKSGAFLAFNRDKTIRTFFKPNDGVRYFERQVDKEH